MGNDDIEFFGEPEIREMFDGETIRLAEQFEGSDLSWGEPFHLDESEQHFTLELEGNIEKIDPVGAQIQKERDRKQEQKPETPVILCKMIKGNRHIFKKVSNPEKLQAEIKTWPFRDGDCYHVETIANVDSFTWLRYIIGLQKAKYVAVSTWALFGDAVQWIMNAQKVGRIGRIDFFIGDNIQVRHPDAYKVMKKLLPECGGRLVIFKNHSKVIAIEGERFDCVIESSANINVNLIPHFENTCITVGRDFLRHTVNTFSAVRPTNANTFSEPYFIDSQEES